MYQIRQRYLYVQAIGCFEFMHTWSVSSPDLVAQWFRLSLKDTRPTFVGNVYQPLDGSVDKAITMLEDRLNNIRKNGNPDIIILGNLNIDLSSKSAVNTKYYNFLKAHMLDQLINVPTRITNTTKSVIGHVVTNNPDFYCTYGWVDLQEPTYATGRLQTMLLDDGCQIRLAVHSCLKFA